jgi:nitrite reductase/ring-hydroxylating ferredoxin subunit
VNVPVSTWIAVAETAKLQEGVPLLVKPRGIGILLFKRGDAVYAVRNKCPHMACPMEQGDLDEFALTCPCHGWTFDIRDGSFVRAPQIKVAIYATKIEGDNVLIDFDEEGE